MKATVFSHQQQGAATLLTALVLLISITLVVLVTSKTVLVETQISADNYRTQQATAAATAAMDQAVAYYKAGGFDQRINATGAAGTDGQLDYVCPGIEPTTTSCVMPAANATTAFPLTLTSGAQITFAHFVFYNSPPIISPANSCEKAATIQNTTIPAPNFINRCDAAANGVNTTQGLITAKGWSDDCTAVRTITQCVAMFNIFSGDGKGPQQPFVGKGGVGAFGNAKIINRYTNSSIWSGGADVVHGASFGTYLRPSNTEIADYTQEQLDSSCEASPCNVAGNPGPNTQLVSNRDAGTGLDVITNDPTLGTKTTSTTNLIDPTQNQFFDMFFGKTKSVVKNQADGMGQSFPAGTSLNGKKGLMWVEGNVNINGTDVIGTPTEPAILIINGNLDKLNGATIYGVVYVTGTIEIAGNPIVKGSIVAENPTASTGSGTLTLVYKPWGSGGDGTTSPPFIPGTGAIIAGSWKDW